MNRKNTHTRFVVGMSIFFFFALFVLPHAAWCEYPDGRSVSSSGQIPADRPM